MSEETKKATHRGEAGEVGETGEHGDLGSNAAGATDAPAATVVQVDAEDFKGTDAEVAAKLRARGLTHQQAVDYLAKRKAKA